MAISKMATSANQKPVNKPAKQINAEGVDEHVKRRDTIIKLWAGDVAPLKVHMDAPHKPSILAGSW